MRHSVYVYVTVFCAALFLSGCLSSPSGTLISGYNSMYGVGPRLGLRIGAHPAIDYIGVEGEPVIAAIDGQVEGFFKEDQSLGCGNGLMLSHNNPNSSPEILYTTYCHLQLVVVKKNAYVKRGDTIGLVGRTGNSEGISHVHFQLSIDKFGHEDGDLSNTINPDLYMVGCFDRSKKYSTKVFVLTIPVECDDKKYNRK